MTQTKVQRGPSAAAKNNERLERMEEEIKQITSDVRSLVSASEGAAANIQDLTKRVDVLYKDYSDLPGKFRADLDRAVSEMRDLIESYKEEQDRLTNAKIAGMSNSIDAIKDSARAQAMSLNGIRNIAAKTVLSAALGAFALVGGLVVFVIKYHAEINAAFLLIERSGS